MCAAGFLSRTLSTQRIYVHIHVNTTGTILKGTGYTAGSHLRQDKSWSDTLTLQNAYLVLTVKLKHASMQRGCMHVCTVHAVP